MCNVKKKKNKIVVFFLHNLFSLVIPEIVRHTIYYYPQRTYLYMYLFHTSMYANVYTIFSYYIAQGSLNGFSE